MKIKEFKAMIKESMDELKDREKFSDWIGSVMLKADPNKRKNS